MIRNDCEYEEAVKRIQDGQAHISESRANLEKMGLHEDDVRVAIEPMNSFLTQLMDDVRRYENIKTGQFWDPLNFDEIGQLLIAIRIARGITQRQMAERLGVSETQVSRDEKNEYHGASITRIHRILKSLDVELRLVVVDPAKEMNYGPPVKIADEGKRRHA